MTSVLLHFIEFSTVLDTLHCIMDSSASFWNKSIVILHINPTKNLPELNQPESFIWVYEMNVSWEAGVWFQTIFSHNIPAMLIPMIRTAALDLQNWSRYFNLKLAYWRSYLRFGFYNFEPRNDKLRWIVVCKILFGALKNNLNNLMIAKLKTGIFNFCALIFHQLENIIFLPQDPFLIAFYKWSGIRFRIFSTPPLWLM